MPYVFHDIHSATVNCIIRWHWPASSIELQCSNSRYIIPNKWKGTTIANKWKTTGFHVRFNVKLELRTSYFSPFQLPFRKRISTSPTLPRCSVTRSIKNPKDVRNDYHFVQTLLVILRMLIRCANTNHRRALVNFATLATVQITVTDVRMQQVERTVAPICNAKKNASRNNTPVSSSINPL